MRKIFNWLTIGIACIALIIQMIPIGVKVDWASGAITTHSYISAILYAEFHPFATFVATIILTILLITNIKKYSFKKILCEFIFSCIIVILSCTSIFFEPARWMTEWSYVVTSCLTAVVIFLGISLISSKKLLQKQKEEKQ